MFFFTADSLRTASQQHFHRLVTNWKRLMITLSHLILVVYFCRIVKLRSDVPLEMLNSKANPTYQTQPTKPSLINQT